MKDDNGNAVRYDLNIRASWDCGELKPCATGEYVDRSEYLEECTRHLTTLKRVEWCVIVVYDGPLGKSKSCHSCPMCGGCKSDGAHADVCEVAAEIKRLEGLK